MKSVQGIFNTNIIALALAAAFAALCVISVIVLFMSFCAVVFLLS